MLAITHPAPVAAPRRGVVAMAQAQQPAVAPVSRRSTAAVLLALAAAPLLLAAPAEAKDAQQAARAAAERKAKLKAAAEAMAEGGKLKNAFATSRYGLSEEATSPNMRSEVNTRKAK